MNTNIIIEVAHKTLAGTIPFPEVVGQLLTAGVEYYHVDYVGLKKTFYGTDGDMVVTPINYEGLPPVAADFSVENVRADILDSQRNGQKYRDFTRRAVESGVQDYFAFLRGKRVSRFRSCGASHNYSLDMHCGAKAAALRLRGHQTVSGNSKTRNEENSAATHRRLSQINAVGVGRLGVWEIEQGIFQGALTNRIRLPANVQPTWVKCEGNGTKFSLSSLIFRRTESATPRRENRQESSMKFFAHTATLQDGKPDPDQGHWQPLSEHLRNVARRRRQSRTGRADA